MLYSIFPLLCITSITPSYQKVKGSFATRIVYGIAIYELLLIVIGFSLGFSNQLNNSSYFVVTLIITQYLPVRFLHGAFYVSTV